MPHPNNSKSIRRFVAITALMAASLAAAFAIRGSSADAQAPGTNRPGANLAIGMPATEQLEGADCASGISIRIEFGHLCTEVCAVDSDCLEGWGCKVIEQGNGEPIGLCVPRRISVESPSP